MSNLLTAIPRAAGAGWAITESGRKYIRRIGFGSDTPFYTEYIAGRPKAVYPENNCLNGEKIIADGDGKPEWCPV